MVLFICKNSQLDISEKCQCGILLIQSLQQNCVTADSEATSTPAGVRSAIKCEVYGHHVVLASTLLSLENKQKLTNRNKDSDLILR